MATGDQVHELIQQQTAGWREAIRMAEPLDATARHLFLGSGSSYYIAMAAAAVGRRAGLRVQAISAAEACLEPEWAFGDCDVVTVISRSGTTSEALWALSNARDRGLSVQGITADPESQLAREAALAVASTAWEDHTVVMVRSFSGLLTYLLAAIARSTEAGEHESPLALLADGFDTAYQAGQALLAALAVHVPRRIAILGAGAREGIALEGVLKITEMAHIAAQAHGPLEFRHGPRGALTADDWVILLGQTEFAPWEGALLRDIAPQTSHLTAIARPGWFERAGDVPGLTRALLPDAPSDWWNGPLAVVPLQELAWGLALAAGQDPDQPANLSKVVEISRG